MKPFSFLEKKLILLINDVTGKDKIKIYGFLLVVKKCGQYLGICIRVCASLSTCLLTLRDTDSWINKGET